MDTLQQYRTKAKATPDLLNFAALVGDGVVQGKDGSLLVGYFYRGNDTASSTADERNYLTARINAALSKFGDGWVTWHDASRIPANHYPSPSSSHFADPISTLIDDERRNHFEGEGRHFVTQYTLVISYLPPLRSSSRVNDLLWSKNNDAPKKSIAEDIYDGFMKALYNFEDLLADSVKLRRMTSYYSESYNLDGDDAPTFMRDELVDYLNFCITGKFQPINIPPVAMYLDALIGSHLLVNGDTPKIGDLYVCPIAIDGFPAESYPNILEVLEQLPIPYRFSSRMVYLDKQTSLKELTKFQKRWKQKVRGFMDQVFKTPNPKINQDALRMSLDADAAYTDAESGAVNYGYYTPVVLLTSSNLTELHENARYVTKEISKLGFLCRVETINSLEAWLGSIPGHVIQNLRRPMIHTLNLADLLPTSSIWAGNEFSPNPFLPRNSPPLMYCATSGSTPFRLNLHVDDLGHTLIFGPTGTGKSVLLNTLAMQFRRYRNDLGASTIYSFDKGKSMWASVKATGGTFYDIGGEDSSLCFAPLSEIDTDADLAWAAEWVYTCFQLATDYPPNPEQKQSIFRALNLMRETSEKHQRSLSELLVMIQDTEIRSALNHYTLSGSLGKLLDSTHDELSTKDASWLCFEIESLMALGDKNLIPVLLYLFRRVEKSLNGQPAMITLDEAWVMLGHPVFREKIKEWLKVLRKANCIVLLATQSLSDAIRSGIFDVLIESCPTKILLANPEADKKGTEAEPGPKDMYMAMGMNEAQISIIKNMTRKRDYYFVSTEGRRVFSLALDQTALAFVACGYKDNYATIEKLEVAHGKQWPWAWLKQRGVNHHETAA